MQGSVRKMTIAFQADVAEKTKSVSNNNHAFKINNLTNRLYLFEWSPVDKHF